MNQSAVSQPVESADSSSPRGLLSASFMGLLATQCLTALNDNAFRWLVIGVGKQKLEEAGTEAQMGYVLMAGTACFVFPYLVFAAPAGYLADRYSKRSVIVACKLAEIGIMLLGMAALLSWNLWFLFGVLMLMGAQSTLFSPARLGLIPEMLGVDRISVANGLMGLTTVIATVVGMAVGNLLADAVRDGFAAGAASTAAVLWGVAIAGWLSSLPLAAVPAANPSRHFPWDAPVQTIRDLRTLGASRPLLRVALGIMFFWSVGALAQLNIDQFAFESGATRQAHIVPLLLCLVAGVGSGSVAAGIWSGGRVELGILPLGAGGVAIMSVALFTVPSGLLGAGAGWSLAYLWASFLLFALGFSAGLFDVPLASYMQHRSPPASRGAILAASNFLTFAGILAVAGLYALLRAPLNAGQPLFTSRQIFLLSGLFTVFVFGYIVWLIPQASIRFLVWLASRLIYRIRVFGLNHLPAEGGALLVANHISWLDGILLMLVSPRPVRMVAFAGNLTHPVVRWLARLYGVIMITPRPKSILSALQAARQALLDGQLVCIFPEGGITRTGQVQAFRPGLMKILEGAEIPVIPVYLDELWGSIFSYSEGKVLWKWPARWPYPISIHFGTPIARPLDVYSIRRAVQELGAMAVKQRVERRPSLARLFVRACKLRKRRSKIADSLGNELTGGQLLLRSLILRRLMARGVLQPDERFVGLLLPPTVGAVVANMALALDRRIPVNLNYTASSDIVQACIRQAGIQHVITSRAFLEKVKLELDTNVVYLEDFRNNPTWRDKLAGWFGAYLVPGSLLARSLGLHRVQREDLATLIFTSGSTGDPKGVMLSEGNIGTNVEAIQQVVRLVRDDVLVGILPFFHSFGYTVTLWAVMAIDVKGVYHFSPLDAKQIGKLCTKHRSTVLLATPTFLRTYLRRCEPEEFATLDTVIVGAEKLPRELADAFEQKFGLRPIEGYGTTELSPLVSVNIPPSRALGNFQVDRREGSVGRPIPGVVAKITDLDTGAELPAGRTGMLWIKGPNVMQGYWQRPELTAEVIQDGWYKTGDVGLIDEDGFIHITGRVSRFSKIGGEMVPHLRVEEVLATLLSGEEGEGPKAVVTAVPDPTKGERLIVVHTSIGKTPSELRKGLAEAGLPNLYIPSEDSFHQVQELPLLGSGKLDLKTIQHIARDAFSER